MYEDQAIQDYVNTIGQRIARHSDMPDLQWHFTVLDDDSVNAFTTGGGYIYIPSRAAHVSELRAELAGVLGHEMGHVTARSPGARADAQRARAVLAAGAASSPAPARSRISPTSVRVRGSRAMAARPRWKPIASASSTPPAPATTRLPCSRVFKVFKAQETFEVNTARAEGREPRIYHGIFSSHPPPDARQVQAAKGAATLGAGEPAGGYVSNRNTFLHAMEGLPFGSSRAQGIVRDNRFYHADMGLTVAFPRGWTIENQRDRILAFTRSKDSLMQITVEARPDRRGPARVPAEEAQGCVVRRR